MWTMLDLKKMDANSKKHVFVHVKDMELEE